MYEIKSSVYEVGGACFNMTTKNIAQVLDLYVERVKTHLKDKLTAVYLFGSVARGDYTSESDIDIMLVLDMDEHEIRDTRAYITRFADDLDLDYNVLINKFSIGKNDFEKMENTRLLFINVQNEGVILYDEKRR